MEGSSKPMPRPRYYTQQEVAEHHTDTDCWLSYHGFVYDLTPLVREHKGSGLALPIIEAAGTDISHWFDRQTKDVRMRVDVVTGCKMPHTPMGRFVHIPPTGPSSNWRTDFGLPWWRRDNYRKGVLSKKSYHIRLVNTVTSKVHTVEVCHEEMISEILQRYLYINRHAASYTWKFNGKPLDMDKTLEENGIFNLDEDFYQTGIDEEEYRPGILLHYNDNLTEM